MGRGFCPAGRTRARLGYARNERIKMYMNGVIDPETSFDRTALRRQLQRLAVLAGLLAVCFGLPLLQLISFAANSELFSCILLVPFISGYLIWTMRKTLNLQEVRPCWPGAVAGWMAGGAIIAVYWLGRRDGWTPQTQDYLTLMTLAFLCCFWGACLAMLGSKVLGQILFPLAFLLFAVPMPTSWLAHIDTFFQYTSAATAVGFFKVAGEPIFRDGLILHLTGDFSLRVAPECSGIHSTLVLLLTSFLAGYLFLPRYWSRTVLVLAVIPLAILRNGFRIFVVGWLCVHIGPEMIDSPVHRKGGPLFFALALIPFFLLLVFLRKRDTRLSKVPNNQPIH
jgi:exosortase C (VPDSG-CTERM-specific)